LLNLCRETLTFESFLRKLVENVNIDMKTVNGFDVPAPEGSAALYIHVPFCTRMCPFCIFFSVPYSEERVKSYFKALRSELEAALSRYEGTSFRDVYVGGGTPTLATEEVCEALDMVRSAGHRFEASVEASPYDIDDYRANQLASAGVTRISIGVQSFSPEALRRIGRPMISKEGIASAIDSCLKVGTVNVDLLFNYPGQREADLERDVEAFYESSANQLTLYPLMPSIKGKSIMPGSDENERKLYYAAVDRCRALGLSQDTAWSFSRGGAGLKDEYIVDNNYFIGVGAGAMSHVRGLYAANTFNLAKYERLAPEGRSPVTLVRGLCDAEEQRVYVLYKLYGLRLDKRDFRRTFGKSIYLAMPREVAAMEALGLVRDEGRELVVTRKGLWAFSYLMKGLYINVSHIRATAIRNGI